MMITPVIAIFVACFQASSQTSVQKEVLFLKEYEAVRNDSGQITQLFLSGDNETIIGKLRFLSGSPPSRDAIDTISISHTFVTIELIKELRLFGGLRKLRIGEEDAGALETVVASEAYVAIGQLKELRELHIVDADYHLSGKRKHTDVSFIGSLHKLEVLRIDAYILENDLRTIAELPAISQFTYTRDASELPDKTWGTLVHNPSLRTLRIDQLGSGFSPSIVFHDPKRIKLEHLHLGYVDMKSMWTKEDFQVFEKLEKLKTLQLPRSFTQEQMLTFIPGGEIEELTINVKDTVKSLPFIQSIKKLKKLAVQSPEFQALGDLVAHPALTDITLECKCVPSELRQLQSLPSLKRLSVWGDQQHMTEVADSIPTVEFRVISNNP